MTRPIHVTAGNHAAPAHERGLDVYQTPPLAVEKLLGAEDLPIKIWEPCDPGDSNITTVLKAHGHKVVANDIAVDGIDFRDRGKAPPGLKAIVTNPPFQIAASFVMHGLKLVPKVIILERIQFLEAEVRAELFDAGKLTRIWIFRKRLPRMHRVGWTGKTASAAMTLAWFVFDVAHYGSEPRLGWI